MPILGLFPSAVENDQRRRAGRIASGVESSSAVKGIRQGADVARRSAFANAYQSRGNPALAQRQANQASTDATMQASGQVAQQTTQDQAQARADIQRMDAERMQGINSAIGFGAQAAGTLFGGPAGGAAAKVGADALTGGITDALAPVPAKPAASPPPAAPQTMGGADTMSLVQGANAPVPTQASPQGMQAVQQALVPSPVQAPLTQPDAVPVNTGLAALYDRPGNQRDPAVDADWRRRFGQAYWGGQ